MEKLTDEEIHALKRLVPLADEIVKDAEYQKSRNIVWQHWKALVVGVATFLIAALFLWEKFKAAGAWLFR